MRCQVTAFRLVDSSSHNDVGIPLQMGITSLLSGPRALYEAPKRVDERTCIRMASNSIFLRQPRDASVTGQHLRGGCHLDVTLGFV